MKEGDRKTVGAIVHGVPHARGVGSSVIQWAHAAQAMCAAVPVGLVRRGTDRVLLSVGSMRIWLWPHSGLSLPAPFKVLCGPNWVGTSDYKSTKK